MELLRDKRLECLSLVTMAVSRRLISIVCILLPLFRGGRSAATPILRRRMLKTVRDLLLQAGWHVCSYQRE
jgi:hypothetical protein